MANFKAVDFFCGGGGMTCGLRQAGVNVIAGVDFDKDCKETYEINNPGSAFVLADITKLPSNHFAKKFGLQKDDDNLIFIGCSPCQYYSIINTSKEKSKKSKDLLKDFRRFIRYYNPGYVLVENVPGIETREDSVLPEFLSFLKKRKYTVKFRIINMHHYGVPQNRRRFSLIASRVNENIDLPTPDKEEKLLMLRDVLGKENGFIPIPAGHRDETDFMHTSAGLKRKNIERLKKTPHDGGTRLSWKDDSELQLPCYVGNDNSFVDVYGRMFWNKPASTITTKFYSISNGRFAHPNENRAISLREGAVIQTFPRDYIFKTQSIRVAAKLIGNAVPPEYATRLGEVIIKRSANHG